MNKNKKIILEIVLIALCLGFLEFQVLMRHKSIIQIAITTIVILVSFRLIIKLIKEISIKQDGVKKKVFRIILLVINTLVLFSYFYQIFVDTNIVLSYLATILTGVLAGYLGTMAIVSLISINKANKLYMLVKEALFNTIFFILLVIPILITIY